MTVKMKNKITWIFLLWGLLILPSCEKQIPVEEEVKNPIRDPQFVFMRESNLLYFAVSCEEEFEGELISSVLVEWYGQDSTYKDSIWLNDDGYFGDLISNDGLYSRKISNETNSIINIIQPDIVGEVLYKISGNYGARKFEIFQTSFIQNIHPVILSVTAPDTIQRPVGTEIDFIIIAAEVFDENGPEDIFSCGFTSLHIEPDTLLNNGDQILMYDDGGTVEIFPSYFSGDEMEGDGRFSIQIPIFGSGNTNPAQQTKTGTFLWTFRAKDQSNDYSFPIEHRVVVE